jgi:excisionase family DNA binding protein
MLSIGEAAEVLGICPATLRGWERDGKIQPERTLGGHRRYQDTDVAMLLRKRGMIPLGGRHDEGDKEKTL